MDSRLVKQFSFRALVYLIWFWACTFIAVTQCVRANNEREADANLYVPVSE